MEESGQLHAPGQFIPGKVSKEPIEREIWWTPDAVEKKKLHLQCEKLIIRL
jgi:hypothetical protein